MTTTTTDTTLRAVQAHFPTWLRSSVTRAGESGDYYLTLHGCPIEVRHTPSKEHPIMFIVPEVGMADGMSVWVWSAESERYLLTPHWARGNWIILQNIAYMRRAEYDKQEAQSHSPWGNTEAAQ